MSKLYEHLHVDISPRALELIADMIESGMCADAGDYQEYGPEFLIEPGDVQREVNNFVSECRARVQHANAGIEDPPENCTCPTVPGRSDNDVRTIGGPIVLYPRTGDEDWLS